MPQIDIPYGITLKTTTRIDFFINNILISLGVPQFSLHKGRMGGLHILGKRKRSFQSVKPCRWDLLSGDGAK